MRSFQENNGYLILHHSTCCKDLAHLCACTVKHPSDSHHLWQMSSVPITTVLYSVVVLISLIRIENLGLDDAHWVT